MTTPDSLRLHEEVLLLALRDKEGTVVPGTSYHYAIGGALLAELLLARRISILEPKKRLVEVVDSQPVGEPLLDEALFVIGRVKRRAPLRTWVGRFACLKRLKQRIAERLCERGILRADQRQVLLFFTQKIYPEINPEPERRLIDGLREAIFGSTENVDPRTVIRLSLANSAGLLKAVFGKRELKAHRARIQNLVKDEPLGMGLPGKRLRPRRPPRR